MYPLARPLQVDFYLRLLSGVAAIRLVVSISFGCSVLASLSSNPNPAFDGGAKIGTCDVSYGVLVGQTGFSPA